MKTKTMRYKVTFDSKPEYNAIWTIELGESGAFKYGNGTCVIVTVNGKEHALIDTRYESGIIQNFAKWCDELMDSQFDPDFGPHIERLDEEI